MPRKITKRNNDDNGLLDLKPSKDFVDPGTPHSGKKRPVYTSGYLYKQETGRDRSPGMSGTLDVKGHGKKKVPDTGAWNRVKVEKGAKAPGAQRGVGQPTIDGFIQGLEKNRKKGKR